MDEDVDAAANAEGSTLFIVENEPNGSINEGDGLSPTLESYSCYRRCFAVDLYVAREVAEGRGR